MHLPRLILLTLSSYAVLTLSLPVTGDSDGAAGAGGGGDDAVPGQEQQQQQKPAAKTPPRRGVTSPRPIPPPLDMTRAQYAELWASHEIEVDGLKPDELEAYFRCVEQTISVMGPPAPNDPNSLWERDYCLRSTIERLRGIPSHATRVSQTPVPRPFTPPPSQQQQQQSGLSSTKNGEDQQQKKPFMEFSNNVRGRVNGFGKSLSRAWMMASKTPEERQLLATGGTAAKKPLWFWQLESGGGKYISPAAL